MTVEAPPVPPLMKTLIPAEFHDRGYLKDWLEKPSSPEMMADVFKKLDGAETLIGKKLGIPAADAKPEEIEKFYAALRPEKDTDYEIKLGEKPDEEFVKEMRAAFHKAGVSKVQAQRFIENITPTFQARQAGVAAEQKKLNDAFDALVLATFGKDNEKVLARAQEAIKEYAPENLKQFLDKLDNNALTILTGVINAIMVKYVPEDDLNGTNKGGAGGGGDISVLREEARKIMARPEYKDFQHPEYEALQKRVKEIYAQVK